MSKEASVFKTMYNRPETMTAPTGTEFDNTYEVIIEKGNHKKLVKSGQTNRYEKIQSFKDECNIENIIARCAVDPSILNARQGIYTDTTKMPKTLAEAQNLLLKLNQDFNKLPVEIRNKFGNSPEKYVQEWGTKDWAKKLGFEEKTEVKETTKEEVKQDA